MKNWFHIMIIGLCIASLKMQSQPFKMESEFPITMSMTPILNSDRTMDSDINLNVLTFNEEEYNVDLLCHEMEKFTYGIAIRLEDGLPVDRTMKFFRELSFFDIGWNYNHKDFNFSMFVSNLMNFKNSNTELEPYLERRSLVAEEVYFNHESTSMINLSVQYKF